MTSNPGIRDVAWVAADTDAWAAEVMSGLVASRTPGERLAMGCAMFDTARALMRAGLCADGIINPVELRVAMFLRTYGSDFEPHERDTIVEMLRRTA